MGAMAQSIDSSGLWGHVSRTESRLCPIRYAVAKLLAAESSTWGLNKLTGFTQSLAAKNKFSFVRGLPI
jgi:hypothetical protein